MISPLNPWPGTTYSTYTDNIWVYKFAFLPHRCYITGKWLWLKKHYIRRTEDYFYDEVRRPIHKIVYSKVDRWCKKEEAIQRILAQSKSSLNS